MKPSQRRRTVRTPELRANEALGLALGRVCMASPTFHEDILAGFALAQLERQAGRKADALPTAFAALEAAGDELARAHDVTLPLPPPASSRRRRRGR